MNHVLLGQSLVTTRSSEDFKAQAALDDLLTTHLPTPTPFAFTEVEYGAPPLRDAPGSKTTTWATDPLCIPLPRRLARPSGSTRARPQCNFDSVTETPTGAPPTRISVNAEDASIEQLVRAQQPEGALSVVQIRGTTVNDVGEKPRRFTAWTAGLVA